MAGSICSCTDDKEKENIPPSDKGWVPERPVIDQELEAQCLRLISETTEGPVALEDIVGWWQLIYINLPAEREPDDGWTTFYETDYNRYDTFAWSIVHIRVEGVLEAFLHEEPELNWSRQWSFTYDSESKTMGYGGVSLRVKYAESPYMVIYKGMGNLERVCVLVALEESEAIELTKDYPLVESREEVRE